MGQNTKEVKVRLNTIKNTRKITKAMELVSAAKMRKAVQAALDTRPYYKSAWGMIDRLLSTNLYFEETNPIKRFFEKPKRITHTTIIAVTSNRGLCGAFNSNIVKQVHGYIYANQTQTVSIIGIGAKGAATLANRGANIALAYKNDDALKAGNTLTEITDHVFNQFLENKTQQVLVAYTDYKSAILQQASLKPLFPFTRPLQINATDEQAIAPDTHALEYEYEPNKFELITYLIPRMAHVELYQALLESNASEHSARMLAMKNASDAAKDMAQELVMLYNKARQAGITQEIAEISAGVAAIE